MGDKIRKFPFLAINHFKARNVFHFFNLFDLTQRVNLAKNKVEDILNIAQNRFRHQIIDIASSVFQFKSLPINSI